MKIGIITLHGENNYGAALQTIGLKTFLEKFGTTKLINYSSDFGTSSLGSVFIDDKEEARRKLHTMMFSLLEQKKDFKQAILPLKRIWKFREFITTHGNLTKPYSHRDLINGQGENFDVYISGSDQIWNPNLTMMDPIFFSTYAPPQAKKISYASSTGGYRFSQPEAKMIREYLSSFTHISTRERDAARMLTSIVSREVKHVLDPVFLLEKKDWLEKFKIQVGHQPYVLVYNMNMDPQIFKIAYHLAKERHISLYNIRNWYCLDQETENKEYIDKSLTGTGPLDFLELFYNADFIVTDSFHGTAFSIIFNKPFVALPPISGPTRITNILELLGLSDRMVAKFEEFKGIDLDINYSYVNKLLEQERFKSINYLSMALTGRGDTESRLG